MNPYARLFSSWKDIADASAPVLIWLSIAGVYFHDRDRQRQREIGPCFLYVLQATAWLCGAIPAIFAVGFLIPLWKTPFWAVWELACAWAVICTFVVLPAIWLMLLAAFVSSHRKTTPTRRFLVICLELLLLDAGLFFLLGVMVG